MIGNGDYHSYKKKILTGLHIVGNIYEGLADGISQAGNGLMKGTAQVIEAKYGKEAGEVTGHIIEGTRNVYKIVDSPYNVAKKQFKPTETDIKKL